MNDENGPPNSMNGHYRHQNSAVKSPAWPLSNNILHSSASQQPQPQQQTNPLTVQQRRQPNQYVDSMGVPLSIRPPNPATRPGVHSPPRHLTENVPSKALRTLGDHPAPSPAMTNMMTARSRSKKGARWDLFSGVLNNRLAQAGPQNSIATIEAMRDRQNSRADMRGPPSTASQSFQAERAGQPQMQEVNFAVIGAESVGKSSFITKALDFSPETTTPLQAKNYTLNGTLYAVRLLEVSSEDVKIQADGQIEWPPDSDMAIARRAQGAIVLYDIMNPQSLPCLPILLSALKRSQIPAVLAACKCDNPPSLREIDPDLVEEKAKMIIDGINVFQFNHTQSDAQQLCVSVLLREVVYGQAGKASTSRSRPRARSNAAAKVRSGSASGARSTASGPSRVPSASASRRDLGLSKPGTSDVSSLSQSHRHFTPSSGRHSPVDNSVTRSPSKSGSSNWPLSSRTSFTSEPSNARDKQSFLDTDEAPVNRGPVPAQFPSPTEQKPASFHELVAYLLSPPETTKDQQFVSIFLAFYRVFAAPFVLLEAIIAHFDIIGGEESFESPDQDEDLRYRDLLIIDQWINSYPGDFAHELTQSKLRDFLDEASGEAKFDALAHQINLALDFVTVDDDTRWGNTDGSLINVSPTKGPRSRQNTFFSNSSVSSAESHGAADGSVSPVSPVSPRPPPRSETDSRNSILTETALSRPSMGLDGTTIILPKAAEAVLREAQKLVHRPTEPLNKDGWRALMASSDDCIARELTRIDWIMFSCIRPRDLIRHVTVPVFDRHRFRSLVNVNRMIDHFNYLAYWVTNIILFRDKPKHRALALEKLMRVARKLRAYNNYNALGAVVAGIQGTAVHRLAATKELVPDDIQRDFLKLEVLMSTPKGHATYRLAWENSRSERIPFLPLHRRDLVTADAGGKTFITPSPPPTGSQEVTEETSTAAKINWKKLTVMGEALLSIQRAQATPYIGLEENAQLRHLILGLDIIKDDDELYERSVLVESSAAGEKDGRRAKLNWFGRY